MKDEDGYTTKELKFGFLKKIKSLEAMLIDDKVGATNASGNPTFEFMLMMNTTRHLLATTKALGEEEDFTNTFPPDNDLTVGDMKD